MPDDPKDFTEPGDPSAAGWDLLADAMEQDPRGITDRILRTLETNKVEAKHQDYDKPRIFFKEYDDLGLVVSVAVNPHYGDSVPMPKIEFNDKDRRKMMRLLGETDEAVLEVFLEIAKMEKVMFAALLELTTSDVSPPFKKTFNEGGFPVTYQLNWPVEHKYI